MTNPPPADAVPTGSEPLPVEYYLWLASIERDVRVRDLTAEEIARLLAALRTPSPVADEAVVQRVARAMADQLRRDTADYPNTAIDTRVCPQEGMWGAEVDGEIDLMSLARAALQQVQPVDGLERVREALEAALCAPDWSASLGHVHEAIRQLDVRPETES